jgi:hypothetical protein
MANYFNKFPTLFYSFDDFKTTERVTNIISRYALEAGLKENTSVYYNYEVRDGDTPEILASKLYNNPERHWIIMMMNDIVDVNYDWPLDYKTLNIYIDNKYKENANSSVDGDGLIWAKGNTHSYYKVETITLPNLTKQIQKFEIDANTYANTVVTLGIELTLSDNTVVVIDNTKETLSYYNYELEYNETKRKIKLMRPEYVPQLEQEVRTAFL